MQPNDFVKICPDPDCSYVNSAFNRRCERCDTRLTDVVSQPASQQVSLIDESSTMLADDTYSGVPKGQAQAPPATPPLNAPRTQDMFSKIPRFKMPSKRERGWLFITALLMILIILLIIIIPGFLADRNPPRVDHSTKGSAPTSSPLPLSLPTGLGVVPLANNQYIGVNDGSFPPFDGGRVTQALKLLAAQQLHSGDSQAAIASWKSALQQQSNDAETLIYIENQRVLSSGKPHLTLIAATAFTLPFPDVAYESELQGIYAAQHKFNTSPSAFQLLVLIANSGSGALMNDTVPVAQQIVRIASKDATVMGVIGWLNSSSTENAVKIFTDAKLPIISPQASSDYLTGISSYFFRVVPPNEVQAQVAVQFMTATLHVTNPVVFVDHKEAYSQNLAQDFEAQFSSSGHLHEVHFMTDTTKDFTPLIQAALSYHPDAFYFAGSSSVDTGLFQNALPTTGADAKIPAFGGDGSYVSHTRAHGRWYFTEYAFHGENENFPLVKQFIQTYSDDFDPGPHPQKPAGYYGYSLPDDHAILAYDATSVVVTALESAYGNGKPPLIPDDLKNELAKVTGTNAFQGVSGQIAFGPDGDPINKAVVILFISSGGLIKLKLVNGCFSKGCP